MTDRRRRDSSPYNDRRDRADDDMYDDDYSEDFDDDDDAGGNKYKQQRRSPYTRTAEKKFRPKVSHGSDSKLNRSNRGGRGRGRGRFSQLGRTSQELKVDNITRRVLSARRLKISEMQNSNKDLQLQLQELKNENKLLKKTQHRTEKALQRFDDQESDLPNLIQRQNNEVRSLREQIRKWREKFEKTDRFLRDAEDDLENAKSKLKKLQNMADEKELPERSELNKKLHNAELDMEAKDVKIKEMEKYIQNLEKNHRHELGIERARQKDIQKQLTNIRDENEKLNYQVKEKDKEIQIKNIYANRAQQRPPHRLPNSYNGTPQGTPPPRKRRPSLSEVDKATPRERAKMMENRRREELRKQRDLKLPLDFEQQQLGYGLIQHEKAKRESELRKLREEDELREQERQRLEEQERDEITEKERRMNEQARREAEDRHDREDRERMKREAKEREIRERERREREERDRRREKEERERRERERVEQERRAAEDRRRFEDDVTLQAERKKKDDILKKLKEIDEGQAVVEKPPKPVRDVSEKKPVPVVDKDPFFVTESVIKEGSVGSMDSTTSSRKSYTFTKPTENLHMGKPSHKDSDTKLNLGSGMKTGVGGAPIRRKTRDNLDSLETGGYNPTFGGGKATTSTAKPFSLFDDDDNDSFKPSKSKDTTSNPGQKSKLMSELFGDSKGSNEGPKQNDIFSTPKAPAKKSTGRSSGFPWDSDGPSSFNQSTMNNTRGENSATLFGGGSALITDDDMGRSPARTNAPLRRPKQTMTAFSSRPTVNAVDHFDDEIEEVIL